MENALVERLGRFFVGGYRAFLGGVVCVYIRCCGNGFLGFRPYGESPFPNAGVPAQRKGNPKGFTLTYGPRCGSGSFAPGLIRGHRLRFASLHLLSMHAAAPQGRCAPTPGSIPPLSLPTGPAIKSGTRANAHRFGWGGAGRVRLWFCGGFTPHPALSPRRGSRFLCFSKPEFNAVSHVGEPFPNHSVSSLSLRAADVSRGLG
ncbi:hypothetical protein GGI52_000350 [Pseudomonas moraviensis]|uniref:Uncharacterized protein n=1 Tax=Pseudomonas moraviensis TaxID=321662 RepID=A0A7Y9VSC0_9PSED|nr:hypothetical protein [Pseudomonas moraviensis]